MFFFAQQILTALVGGLTWWQLTLEEKNVVDLKGMVGNHFLK